MRDTRNRSTAVRATGRVRKITGSFAASGCFAQVYNRVARGPRVEPRAKLRGLHMAERNGQRVGGIRRLGSFSHAKQRAHHQLHLLFVRVSIAGHTGLHLAWRITANGNVALGGGEQNHPSNFSQLERRFDVERGENGLDRNSVRLELLDQIAQQRVNFTETLWKMLRPSACGAQCSESQHPAVAAVAFDHSVSGGAGSGGIDAEHAKETTVGWKRLLHDTECTAAPRARPTIF